MLTEVYQLKQNLKRKSFRGLALDIDETLSATLVHWTKQLQKKFGNPEGLTAKEIITKYRYAQGVPYWQTEAAYLYMQKLREDNALQERLGILKQADKFILQIAKIVPIVAYITVRPESVIPGTKVWLTKHKFPQVPIIAMPKYIRHSEGNNWKAEVLEYLYPEVQGLIDDNPKIIKALDSHYQGKIYLYDHPQRVRSRIKVLNCPDWPAVIKKLDGFYK